jgi:hypothetical protein
VYCTIVFVISLRFVHNYLFEIHFFNGIEKTEWLISVWKTSSCQPLFVKKKILNVVCQICSTINFPLKINDTQQKKKANKKFPKSGTTHSKRRKTKLKLLKNTTAINKKSRSRYSRCPDGRRASEVIVIPCKISLVLVLKFWSIIFDLVYIC